MHISHVDTTTRLANIVSMCKMMRIKEFERNLDVALMVSCCYSCSSSPFAKYMAAFAPAANGIRMLGLGLGLWTNEALVKACSREGGRR